MLSVLGFYVLLIFGPIWAETKKCVKWTPKFVDFDGPSMVYSESPSPNDGIGTQLSIFSMLWMLRRTYNVDVFINQACHDTLATVFTKESLSEIPVLSQYFCNPDDINFEYFTGKFEEIDKRKEVRVGRTLWLWPKTEVIGSVMKNKGLKISGGDYDSKFRFYK